MVSNEKRICEYFLISGFKETRNLYDLSQIYYQGEEICNINVEKATDFFRYKEPIVEIQILDLSPKERRPEGYTVLERTYSKQNKANLCGKPSVDELFLCFRYGRDEPPITDIWAFNPKQKNIGSQENWNIIEKTMKGHSANLHGSSSNPLFLAYKRAPTNAPVDNLVVTDICIILTSKNEFCPPAYSRLDVAIKRTPISNTINICYKKSIVKQHVLTFQPEVIYCLPCTSTNAIVDVYSPDPSDCKQPDSLPEDIRDVANFCMPWGATLESWPKALTTPPPSFVTFVLTNVNYDRMYGAAMLFYEDFDKDHLSEEEATNLGLGVDGGSDMNVFASKSICVLSRWPLFQTFNKVLSFLIQEDERQRSGVVLESGPFNLPLERFISQFLHSVPFPTTEAPNTLLQWDPECAIGIQLPTDAISKFGTSENFYHLVRMLDVEEIVQLFVYMLTEQKILLTSTCLSDLTGIAEALISMIFPFKWSVVYIPFLYLSCIQIIQSPSPYLIGVDSRFFDYFRLPEGVGCVDLINRSIKPPDASCKFLDYGKVLPRSVLKALRSGLSSCKTKVMSFEKQLSLRKATGNLIDEFTVLRKKELIGESIRECFLRAVVIMFKNYQGFLVPLSYRDKEADMFDAEGFLKSVDKNSRPLYQAIFDTQLWGHFIMERSYATEVDDTLAFFDRCVKYVESMDEEQANVSPLLQTDSVTRSEHTKVVPPPDPVDCWSPDASRTTFPRRLDSALMLASTHAAPLDPESGILATTLRSGALHGQEHGSTASLASPDSSIPVLHLRAESAAASAPNSRSRRPQKVTVLKRPFEEQKQARHLGREAKRGREAKLGPKHTWAGHLLTSSYCLWYLSLPGLVGYILDTPGLRESGLADRILELAVQMVYSMHSLRLVLPDEVCYRVLLLLIHQLHPSRLHVSDVPNHVDLNAFSYGLCNQILLEQEIELAQLSRTNVAASDQRGDDNEARVTEAGSAYEETLTSEDQGGQEPGDVQSSSKQEEPGCEPRLVEVGGKLVRLRSHEQGPPKRADRKSQLLFRSPPDFPLEGGEQLFDLSAGIIMSAAPPSLEAPPVLAMFKSPHNLASSLAAEPQAPAIILRSPFSEERSELHASFMPHKRVSNGSSNDDSDRALSSQEAGSATVASVVTSLRAWDSASGSRLARSEVASVGNKTRASFRQLRNAANKSLRSVRSMMTSVGSGGWLSPAEAPPASSSTKERDHRVGQFGMPGTFKPWETSREPRLKMTASADLLTGGDESDQVHASRPCAGTVQQLRRRHNLGTGDGSMESFHSDTRYDQCSSSSSLDADPPLVAEEKIWELITDSLAAVQLPMGKYWEEDGKEGEDTGQPSPSTECTHNVAVWMTTVSECAHCLCALYDDDVMAGWCYDDSDLQSVCAYCDQRFTPQLSFEVFINENEPHAPRTRAHPGRRTLAYKSQINYLSPFVLRKELESVLQQEGELALLRHNFLQEHSILYWNLMWYYCRLALPSHMLSYVTRWMQQRGLVLAALSEANKTKFELLTSLTGHEQVIVHAVCELFEMPSRAGVPLYHRFMGHAALNGVDQLNSPAGAHLMQVVNLLGNSDVRGALNLVLMARFQGKKEADVVKPGPPVRSAYRELLHLAMVITRQSLNLDVFYDSYQTQYSRALRSGGAMLQPQDRPPSPSAFFCRRVFRPLQLL